MSLRARTFACAAAVAAALTLGCMDASAAPAPRPAASGDVVNSKAPRVLPGIRPGPTKLQCREGDGRMDGNFDFGRRPTGDTEYRTPAQTVRLFLAGRREPASMQRLTFERRVPATLTRAEAKSHALFVGLRKDGTVKAQISLTRQSTDESRYWVVEGTGLCVKAPADADPR